jgi:5-methylcytosine-specific restriction endonuclease McrA
MARAIRGYSKPSRRGAAKLKRRSCLRCDRMFLSEGPHNRLCQSCREFLAASPTPAEEYPLGYL